jgi:hypothetical protein
MRNKAERNDKSNKLIEEKERRARSEGQPSRQAVGTQARRPTPCTAVNMTDFGLRPTTEIERAATAMLYRLADR